MLLLQLSYISQKVARNREMSCGLARFKDGPGSAVMKEEDIGYYQFHVKQNNYVYPQNMLY